ncbi:hypothetical protein [Pedobacter cryoconitis]|uniref:Fibronectin type-III domain-containing protein n=1 Tax=Pedobacter cryoconitis TaxID=188932 RepID=A0A7X0J7Z0_9SPHI|nr:hypothetical protein [Pedobacter cryoconitis]MBB6502643.1 hypothetical protein [Pedobacter cryoconitis]
MNKLLTLLVISFFALTGCREFIEPSLGGKTVALLAPGDKLESTIYQQTFWWETHEDALRYRVQIVTPKFDSVAKLIADSVVVGNKLLYSLDPGKYEWRVRPENGSSKGEYTTRSFTIYPSSIKDQTVLVNAPATGLVTGAGNISFEWLKLFGTQNYRLQIDDNNFADETKLTLNAVTANLTYLLKAPAEGTYQWRVRAEAGADNSKWSTVRTFTYDITPPAKVVLTAPGNKQSVAKPVKMLWNSITDADRYELNVFKGDSTIAPVVQSLATNTYTYNDGDSTVKIYWKVRAIDKAGNKGAFSDLFSFIIQ